MSVASPTASLSHVTTEDWGRVYEPAEDSWLLCDALCTDASVWRSSPLTLMLELGSGSGAVCTSALLYLQQQQQQQHGTKSDALSPLCLACDLSPHACRVTASTGQENGVGGRLEVVQCDLLDALRWRLRGAVDLFLFNPPYVPTPSEEVPLPGAFAGAAGAGGAAALDTLPAAWAGGENGREVIDRALPLLKELLRQPSSGDAGGAAYLLLLQDNDPEGIAATLASWGMQASVIARRQAPCESLLVMRVQWAPSDHPSKAQ